MTLAWRMDVWMYGCMYGLASRLGENMPGWRGIIGGGGVGDGKKKKHQGPQSQEFPVDWERGAKQKAGSSRRCSNKGVSGSSAASQRGPLSSDSCNAQDLDGFKVSGPDDRRRGSDEVRRRGGVRVGQTRSSRLQTATD